MPRRIAVRAKPGARVPRVEPLEGGTLLVAVRERALEGEANRAIEAALAAHFGVAPSQVRIVRGARGRDKLVEIG
jgi:uncharacterized protein YggU (UPF0235/DUF167 family)